MAFRRGLLHQLRQRAEFEGTTSERLLRVFTFERFLERWYRAVGEAVVVRGGFALELELGGARSTKDIDLWASERLDVLLEHVRPTLISETEDYLSFELGKREPLVASPNCSDAWRVHVQAKMAGKRLVRFHIDISQGDVLTGPPRRLFGHGLEALGLDPVEHYVYPVESIIAEKVHALSLPRPAGRPNSRLKDLIDIGLLSRAIELRAGALRAAIVATFEARDTHPVPNVLPGLPQSWDRRYRADHRSPFVADLSAAGQTAGWLPWRTVMELAGDVLVFIHPVLKLDEAEDAVWRDGTWKPQTGAR